MPDVYAIWDGLPIWLELKVIKTDKVNLSPQQVAWHVSHSHAGGLSFILVKAPRHGCLFLFEGCHGRSVASEGVSCSEGLRFEDRESMWEGLRTAAREHYEQCLRPCGPAACVP